MVRVANLLSWLAIVVSVFFWLRFSAGRCPGRRDEGPLRGSAKALALVLALGFTLTFYPLVKSFEVGQIQCWLYFGCPVRLVLAVREKNSWPVFFIGLISLVKPQLGLFRPVGLWRRGAASPSDSRAPLGCRGRFPGSLRWANHADYLRALSYMTKHGESYYANQSVNGLLNRLLFNGTTCTEPACLRALQRLGLWADVWPRRSV